MEEESKISFWKKLKISIIGLEDYQKLALQKVGSSIAYLAKLMLIFVFFVTVILTFKFGTVINQVSNYIENKIEIITFADNKLEVVPKENDTIVIEEEKILNGKIIIDTHEISEEQISKYEEEVKGYTNGIVLLRDKIIFKTSMTAVTSTISYADIAQQYNIVKFSEQDILQMLNGASSISLYFAFFITMFIYLFIIYFSTVLIDAILYSLLGYLTGIVSKLRLRYSATYNIAVHALTLPIVLNLLYMIVNLLTGYTIKYFDIMYMAITCIYIVAAILMIKSDLIKRQMELSKIISEQEKVRQEMERKEQEKKEEEEREKIRKEDEKKRQEEKKKSKEENEKEKKKRSSGEGKTPQPEANIKPSNT